MNEFGEELVGDAIRTHNVPEGGYDRWWVVWDGTAGWEVVSPILADLEGFEAIERACRVLKPVVARHRLRHNYRTGTHVHLGWESVDNLDVIRRGIRLARKWEPLAANLVSPSRICTFDGLDAETGAYTYLEEPNEYCLPVSRVFPRAILKPRAKRRLLATLQDTESRYATVNFTRTLGADSSTVEVRMLNGTLDARKIASWISLWQQILFSASTRDEPVGDVDDCELLWRSPYLEAEAMSDLPAFGDEHRPRFTEWVCQREEQVDRLWDDLLTRDAA